MKLSQLALFALSAHGDEAQSYTVPSKPENFVFFETFDSPNALDGWTMSKDKKYDGGKWAIEELQVVDLVAIVAWS